MKKIIQNTAIIAFLFFFSSFNTGNKFFSVSSANHVLQQSQFIDFTLNGTKYHFGDKQVGYGGDTRIGFKDSTSKLEYDTNKVLAAEIQGSTSYPFNTVDIIAGYSNDTIINGKRITYGIQLNIPYQKNFFNLRSTKDMAAARANQSKFVVCSSLQVTFSIATINHVAGTFSGVINSDSTITDGKFNVYAKRE